jgi:hypothetical protein
MAWYYFLIGVLKVLLWVIQIRDWKNFKCALSNYRRIRLTRVVLPAFLRTVAQTFVVRTWPFGARSER